MITGRSISMDSTVWTDIGKIVESQPDGNVSATIEMLCKEAIAARKISDEATEEE